MATTQAAPTTPVNSRTSSTTSTAPSTSSRPSTPSSSSSGKLLRTYSLPRELLKQLYKERDPDDDDDATDKTKTDNGEDEVQRGMKDFEARLQESLSPVGKVGEERRKRLASMMGKFIEVDGEGRERSTSSSGDVSLLSTPRAGDATWGNSPLAREGDIEGEGEEALRMRLMRAQRRLTKIQEEKRQVQAELEEKEQENFELEARVKELEDEVQVLHTEREEDEATMLTVGTPRRLVSDAGAIARGGEAGAVVQVDAEAIENMREELSIMQDMMVLKSEEIDRLKNKVKRLRSHANASAEDQIEEDEGDIGGLGEAAEEAEDIEGQELFFNIQKGMKVKMMKEQLKQYEERLERWEKETLKWKTKASENEESIQALKAQNEKLEADHKQQQAEAAQRAAEDLRVAREELHASQQHEEEAQRQKEYELSQQLAAAESMQAELEASRKAAAEAAEKLKQEEDKRKQLETDLKDKDSKQNAASDSAQRELEELKVAMRALQEEKQRAADTAQEQERARQKELELARVQSKEADEEREGLLRMLVRKEEEERQREAEQQVKKERRRKKKADMAQKLEADRERFARLELELEKRKLEDEARQAAEEVRREEEARARAKKEQNAEQERRDREQREKEEEEARIKLLKKQIIKLEEKEKHRETELKIVRDQLEKLKQELLEREKVAKEKEELHNVEIQKEGRELIDATRESVDMAMQFAREAEARIEKEAKKEIEAGADDAAKQEAIKELKARSAEVMESVKAAAVNVHDVEAQQELANKQRAMGEAIHRVVTLTADMQKKEVQEAVHAVAPQAAASTQTTTTASGEGISVTRAGQNVVDYIQASMKNTESTPQELAKPLHEKITLFVRLLGDVASNTTDSTFRAEMRKNVGILKDRSIQLKILANVSSGIRIAGEGFGGDSSGQVAQTALGMEKQVKDVLNDLAIASVKQRLRETLNQAQAIRKVIAAMQASTI